jgi:magnesium transporter
MNEVMKILAGVTVVFMPLTLVTGIYGMNFSNMPELRTTWGYFAVLGVLLVTGSLLTLWMRRIGWLRRDAEEEAPR